MEILRVVENVLPIDASNIHIDYTLLFDKWYKQPASGTIQKNHIFSFDEATINNCIMTTKQSHNSDVTSTQSIKKIHKNTPECVRKLEILHKRKTFLPKSGLKPIKQVHLFTKWRKVVPHPYKDELCPLPSNEVIQLVLKKRPKKKKQPVTTNTLTTATGTVLPSIQTTPVAPSKNPQHETRTCTEAASNPHHETCTRTEAASNPHHETRTEATVNQVLTIDVGPMGNSFVLCDDECSEYLDDSFDPLELLQQEQRQT